MSFDFNMKLSIIVPIYNEHATLNEIISRIERAPLGNIDKELILVDDHSTDGTREILANYERTHRVIYHERNRGKGAAVRSGIAQAVGDIVLIQDADLEYNPAEYPALVAPIVSGQADVVYGSRFLGDRPYRVLYFWHYVGNRLLTLLSNMFTNLNLSDMETGYKVFRKSVLDKITLCEDGFGFEPEITAKIARNKKWRIYEVGISYAGRTYEEGKKINWYHGLWAVWCIIRYRLW